MSLEDIINKEEDDYHFRSDGIEDFLEDFSKPKNMIVDELSGLEDLADDEVIIDEDISSSSSSSSEFSSSNGKMITTVLDLSISTLLGVLAKDDANKYKAEKEDRKDLEEAISEYVKEKGGDIPPGMMILILVLSIYGGKTYEAFQDRKTNIALERALEKQKELEEFESSLRNRERILREKEDEQTGESNIDNRN